jgi:hypothetical protein
VMPKKQPDGETPLLAIVKLEEEAPEGFDYETQSIDGIFKMPFIKKGADDKWKSVDTQYQILQGNVQE